MPITRTENSVALANGTELFYLQWSDGNADKPVALLTHGTGFVAATFDTVARIMATQFRVIAIDRRGHGQSSKPALAQASAGNYEFYDFAEDCVQFCQQLQLHNIYGVGHSAGGTDLLIASNQSAGIFEKLFVMEPTLADPDQPTVDQTIAWASIEPRLAKMRSRRAVFNSLQDVFDIYQQKEAFSLWSPQLLKEYIHYGFAERADGEVELLCTPAIESAILTPIFLTFANAYHGDHRGSPFHALKDNVTPIGLSSSRNSADIYQELTRRAQRIFPLAPVYVCDGVGHCAAQEDPVQLARNLMDYYFNH